LELISANAYTRPVPTELLGKADVDGNDYPVGLLIELLMATDDNKGAVSIAQKVKLPKHEVLFDKRVESHYLRLDATFNMAPMQFVGFTRNIQAKDKLDVPNENRQYEGDAQSSISNDMVFWVTRGSNLLLDRVSGNTVTPSVIAPVGGADGIDDSGMSVTVFAIPQLADEVRPFYVSMWYREDTVIGWIPNPQPIGTYGQWVFIWFEIDSTGLLFGSGNYFDIRVFDHPPTEDMMDYMLKDVVSNKGNNIMPIWE